MTEGRPDVVIVGAGLAGLACADRLCELGRRPLVLERGDHIGGRVWTDSIDGFLLDRGFQVYLSAYPEAGRRLDLEALDLRHFRPGALVFRGGKLHRVMDVFRAPRHVLSSALAPIGSLWDKLLVAELKRRLHSRSVGSISRSGDRSTEDWLRRFGFSEGMIDGFFRPFYGGIFLERELRTSSRMFAFTFGLFSRGHASLPAGGMKQIPLQLAGRLPEGTIRLNTTVSAVASGAVVLGDGSRVGAGATVVATDCSDLGKLLPGELGSRTWRSVIGIAFTAPVSPLGEPIIALNGSGQGTVNSVSVLSDVAPGYSPDGRALVSVTVLGNPDASNLEDRVRGELRGWFGAAVDAWDHLHTHRIARALPEQPPGIGDFSGPGFRRSHGVYLCGDHCATPSIEGAIRSGVSVAEAIAG